MTKLVFDYAVWFYVLMVYIILNCCFNLAYNCLFVLMTSLYLYSAYCLSNFLSFYPYFIIWSFSLFKFYNCLIYSNFLFSSFYKLSIAICLLRIFSSINADLFSEFILIYCIFLRSWPISCSYFSKWFLDLCIYYYKWIELIFNCSFWSKINFWLWRY